MSRPISILGSEENVFNQSVGLVLEKVVFDQSLGVDAIVGHYVELDNMQNLPLLMARGR